MPLTVIWARKLAGHIATAPRAAPSTKDRNFIGCFDYAPSPRRWQLQTNPARHPGPTTERLGRLAQQRKTYVVAGLYERVGGVVYNTAVLVDRQGRLLGKYRKTHLPREEWEAGITPGDDYPVFTTDFGKVGLIICWDLHFPEPSRAMAAQGAELLALPIWGGNETLARARAIENCVYLISATYDMRSLILDPTGRILAEATREQPVAHAQIDLSEPFYQPWIGDMKTRTWKEWRPDLPIFPRPAGPSASARP